MPPRRTHSWGRDLSTYARRMAHVRNRSHSPAGLATHRVMMADIDATVAGGESRFPDGITFVASDVVTDAMIRDHHAEGCAVVVVDEQGNERFLPAP
jgi:hypothetical protein